VASHTLRTAPYVHCADQGGAFLQPAVALCDSADVYYCTDSHHALVHVSASNGE
jgi:hypothetical protein